MTPLLNDVAVLDDDLLGFGGLALCLRREIDVVGVACCVGHGEVEGGICAAVEAVEAIEAVEGIDTVESVDVDELIEEAADGTAEAVEETV